MKAMILAAGLGTRMRPLTLDTPKPLLKVNGTPLIEYHVRRLVQAGFTEIVINHAWLGQQIEDYLGDGQRFGAAIQYSAEPEPLETAGGIRQALDLLSSDCERFLVVNGDVFTNYPFQELLARRTAKVHMVLVPNPEHNPQGDFAFSHGHLSDGGEKFTFSGISVLSAELFRHLENGQAAALAPIFRAAIADDQATAELHQGYWADIGTPQRLEEIDRLLKENKIHGL